jgi:ATP-dependent protease ClpP protease subunit
MIHGILNAPAEDTIHIHLNTPGGDLSAGVQIVNAMKSSAATIVCSIEGEACSLGSLIFLAADQFIVHDDAIMLIHNLSHGVYGKGKESSMQMDATLKWFKALAEKYYIPFLTDKELEQVLDDKDKWFTSAEIRRRLNKMIKIKKRELKELEEAE